VPEGGKSHNLTAGPILYIPASIRRIEKKGALIKELIQKGREVAASKRQKEGLKGAKEKIVSKEEGGFALSLVSGEKKGGGTVS